MAKSATKKKVVSLKGRTETWLKTHSEAKKAVVEADAKKISSLKNDIDKQQKVVDKTDDYLSKASGYNDQKAAYDAKAKELADEQAKLAKASKKDKKAIEAKIKGLKKDKASITTTIKKITSSAGYSKYWNQRKTAKNNISQDKGTISKKNAKKKNDKKTAKKYTDAYSAKKAKTKAKLVKKNSAAIQNKIKKAKSATGINAGYTTAVYRADCKTSRVFMLGEVDPNENNDQNHVTHSVDAKDSRITHGSRSSKQLSGTYYLKGNSFREMDNLYAILQGWQRKNIELVIRGFSRWNHAYISSIGKTTLYKNALTLPVTFDYELRAHIKSAKKSKKKTIAAASPKKGTSKSTKKTVTIKSGMTYWWVAQHYNVSISWLEKHNKWSARSIPIGAKVRYK